MARRRRRSAPKNRMPKGAYRLPTGGYMTERVHAARGRTIRIRAVYRDEPDIKKLVAVLLDLARHKLDHDD